MNNDMVTVRNKITLKVDQIPRKLAEHPILGAGLEIVPDGSKPILRFGPVADAPAEVTEEPEKATTPKGRKR